MTQSCVQYEKNRPKKIISLLCLYVHSMHYLLPIPSSMLYYLLQMSGDQSGLTKPNSTVASDPNFVDNRMSVQMQNGSAVLPQAYDEFGNAINENMVSQYSLGCFKL